MMCNFFTDKKMTRNRMGTRSEKRPDIIMQNNCGLHGQVLERNSSGTLTLHPKRMTRRPTISLNRTCTSAKYCQTQRRNIHVGI